MTEAKDERKESSQDMSQGSSPEKEEQTQERSQDRNQDREVTFDIKEHIGVLSQQNKGWKKELNIVAWNNGAAKYDIRDWNENHQSMKRGITLNKEEAQTLVELLSAIKP